MQIFIQWNLPRNCRDDLVILVEAINEYMLIGVGQWSSDKGVPNDIDFERQVKDAIWEPGKPLFEQPQFLQLQQCQVHQPSTEGPLKNTC